MFALATTDIVHSIYLGSSNLPVPRGTSNIVYAIGTKVSCNVQGFIGTFTDVALPLYYCGLTGYFFLSIKLELCDDVLSRYYEPTVHGISIGYALLGAIFISIHHGGFNVSSGNSLCTIAPEPYDCLTDASIDCEKGNDSIAMRWIFLFSPIIFSFVIITTSMLIIFWTLLRKSKTSHITVGSPLHANNEDDHRYDIEQQTSRRDSVLELYAASKRKRKSSRADRDRKEGMKQALLYIIAFLVCQFFPFLVLIINGNGNVQPETLLLFLTKILFPCQGFANFFVFIRPRVINTLRRNSTLSLFSMKVLKMAILNKGETRSASRRRDAIFRKFSRRDSSISVTNNYYSVRGFADGDFSRRLSLELDSSDHDDEQTGGGYRLLPATSERYSILHSEFRHMDPSLFE